MMGAMQGKPGMIFTIEFFRIRPSDDAHATLDRFSVIIDDLDAVKVKARSLFETLKMPHKRDGLRILDEGGCELEALKARSAPPTLSATPYMSCGLRRERL